MSRRVGSHRVTAPAPQGAACPTSESPGLSCLPPVPSSSQSTRQPPAAKNLRWTAMAVVSVLSNSQEQHVDAVVERVASAAKTDGGGDLTPAVRNARRRVHDALKVMIAVGCVNRTGENLRWIGVEHLQKGPPLPSSASSTTANCEITATQSRVGHRQRAPFPLPTEICKLRIRIAHKRSLLTTLKRHVEAFRAVAARHQRISGAQKSRRRNRESRRLHFPFVLVKVPKPNVVYTPDRSKLRMDAENAFRLYSETDVVCFLADRWSPYFRKRRARAARLVNSHGRMTASGQLDSDNKSGEPEELHFSKNATGHAQSCTMTDTDIRQVPPSIGSSDKKSLHSVAFLIDNKSFPDKSDHYSNSDELQNKNQNRKDDMLKRQRFLNRCVLATDDARKTVLLEESVNISRGSKTSPSDCLGDDPAFKFKWDDTAECYDSNGEDFGEGEIDSYELIDSGSASDFLDGHVYNLPLFEDDDDSKEVDACLEAVCSATSNPNFQDLDLTMPPQMMFEHVKPEEAANLPSNLDIHQNEQR